jgi:hypothetical protein
MSPPFQRFGGQVVAPFSFQPTRRGLRGGFGSLSAGSSAASGPPVGAGAGAGAEIGASQGAAIGSSFGPIGTAIGAIAGAIGGAIAGSINKKDPEQYDFDAAVALWQANRLAVLNIGNKYLPLAGLFDLSLSNPHIPIYQKYGRMGEQKFVTDMVNLIYQAAINGQITATDTPSSVMSRIVQPWIDSWNYGPMQDPHADLINLLLVGMVSDYITGDQTAWTARSGDYPFGSLPAFPMATVLAASAPAAPTTTVNPVGSTAATPVVTTPAYSSSGSVITVTAPGTLTTPIGTFLVSGTTYAMNGAAVATYPTTVGLSYVGGQVYRYDADGTTYAWSNNAWVAAAAPAAPAAIAGAITPSTGVNPVGSGVTTSTALTPAQLVANPPAVGAAVAYAPDMSQNGTPMALPSGLVFEGTDPYNRSWILQGTVTGQQYVLWGGQLQPYTSTMFAPASTATTAQGASVVTGSGTTGVNTGTASPLAVDQTAATAPASTTDTTSNMGWILGIGLVGILLASGKHRGRAH